MLDCHICCFVYSLNNSILLYITISALQIRKLRLRAIVQNHTRKSIRAKIHISVNAPPKPIRHLGKSKPFRDSLLALE